MICVFFTFSDWQQIRSALPSDGYGMFVQNEQWWWPKTLTWVLNLFWNQRKCVSVLVRPCVRLCAGCCRAGLSPTHYRMIHRSVRMTAERVKMMTIITCRKHQGGTHIKTRLKKWISVVKHHHSMVFWGRYCFLLRNKDFTAHIQIFIMNRFFKYDVISTTAWWKLISNLARLSYMSASLPDGAVHVYFSSLPIITPQTQHDGPACCRFLLIVLPAYHLWSAHSFSYVPLSVCQCCFPCSSWVMSLIVAPRGWCVSVSVA